jgi:hypothetical protein
MAGEWRNVDLGNGEVVPIRRGSPADAGFPESGSYRVIVEEVDPKLAEIVKG